MTDSSPTSTNAPTGPSRATFLRFAVAGTAAAAITSPLIGASPAHAAEAARATNAGYPIPSSGGLPPGPSTHGFLSGDVLNWSPETDKYAEHFRCLIPRAKRIAPFSATQAHPTLDPTTQLLTVDGDYRGDVYDIRAQPIGDEDQVYTQRYWPYIDIFSSWHGQVVSAMKNPEPGDDDLQYGVIDIPNPGWTEAAHKNGARTIGCWYWPRNDNFDNWVRQDASGEFPVGKKLVEIKQYFGFDGYFINQEAAVTKRQITALFDMFRYMKSLDDDLYIQYYDADLPGSGKLDYQNEINEKNVGSLGTPDDLGVDSIFMNYDWPKVDPDLTGSRDTVLKHGFDPKVAAYGSTECQQGGFNPRENFSDYANPKTKAPVSWAIFVENEYWNLAAKEGITDTVSGRRKYRDYERKFWSGPKGDPSQSGRIEPRKPPYRTDVLNTKVWDGVAHSIVEKSAISSLPILTNFNIGTGSRFAVEGRRVSNRSWDNAGIADPSLTWQYWTEHSGNARSTLTLDETKAWDGGHSLALTGTAAGADAVTLHSFKTEVRLPHGTEVSVKLAGTTGAVELGLTFQDSSDSPEWTTMHGRHGGDGWRTLTAHPHHRAGRTVAKISLRIHGNRACRIDVNIGQFKAARPPYRKPETPRQFTIDSVDDDGGTVSAYFSWKLERSAYAYDLFAVHGHSRTWIGRVHRKVFYSHDIPVDGDRLNIELVPIAKDGTRGRPATAKKTLH